MEIYKFKCWCEKAVSGIVFPPDQRKVYRELMDHMEDHCDYLLELGYDKDTAQQMTVDAMGDPWPIAKDLAAIHRPFWGYFLRVTRVILIFAAIVTLIPFFRYAWETKYQVPMWGVWSDLSGDATEEDSVRTMLLMSEPGITRTSDGYTYTLTDAVYWHNNEYDTNVFYVWIKESHPLPWAEHGAVGKWFWAEDSLGNIYECNYSHYPNEETPVMYCYGHATSPFSYTYAMWLSSDLPEDAEWVDIRYTRDGRNLVFHVDVTGGDTA